MTGRFTETQIESARRRFRLSDLIARDGIKLVRHGSEFSGLCPFHSERSPSFTVVDGKGFYHCFGCGVHGDAIAWRMEYCGDSFSEAVAALAGDAPATDAQRVRDLEDRRNREEERIRASRAAGARAVWFASVAIAGTPGEGYFRARGISLPLPPSLRWNPALIHGPKDNRRVLPGIVAGVQNLTGQVIAVHRIYLDPASFRTGPSAARPMRRARRCSVRRRVVRCGWARPPRRPGFAKASKPVSPWRRRCRAYQCGRRSQQDFSLV